MDRGTTVDAVVHRVLAALERAGQVCDTPPGSQSLEAMQQQIIAMLSDPPWYLNTSAGQVLFLKILRQIASDASDIVKNTRQDPGSCEGNIRR